MPTTKKQTETFKRVMKGESTRSAMKKAGYSDATIVNPQNVTKSKGWKELEKKYLPDKMLLRVHKQGLKAVAKKPHMIDRDDKGKPIYEYVSEVDYQTRHKYLETAYKIKGKFQGNNIGVAVQVNINEDKEKFA